MGGKVYGNGHQLMPDTAAMWATRTLETWEQVDVGAKAFILLCCLEYEAKEICIQKALLRTSVGTLAILIISQFSSVPAGIFRGSTSMRP
jgi:hypothetical protein